MIREDLDELLDLLEELERDQHGWDCHFCREQQAEQGALPGRLDHSPDCRLQAALKRWGRRSDPEVGSGAQSPHGGAQDDYEVVQENRTYTHCKGCNQWAQECSCGEEDFVTTTYNQARRVRGNAVEGLAPTSEELMNGVQDYLRGRGPALGRNRDD